MRRCCRLEVVVLGIKATLKESLRMRGSFGAMSHSDGCFATFRSAATGKKVGNGRGQETSFQRFA
jgi:hypothetical protein